MHKFSPQLTLGFNLKDEATFANFYAGENAEIIAELKKIASGQGERVIYLCGARGQGRSHLLQASCHYAHQHRISSVYLPLADLISLTPEVLNGFESLQLVCIDDLHRVAGKPEWEEAIFHLYNRIYDAGGKIIIAANDLPKAIYLGLPDLISRLSWGIIFQLHPLVDTEKLFILTRRANLRGISLSEEVGKYILTHCPRHMGTLFAALDALDKASLAAQRRLTIPFVKEVLEI
jgi:DnaA family protein